MALWEDTIQDRRHLIGILTMDLGEHEWADDTKKRVGKLRKPVGKHIFLAKLDEGENVPESPALPPKRL